MPSPFPQLEPRDAFNRTLEQHVHPPDWQNPTPSSRYNLVVIGAGTAGLVTAAGAAGLGAKVALIEKQLMGGDCLNVGCVPSKAIISSARVAAQVRAAGPFGVNVSADVQVDFGEVMKRMRRLRSEISPHDSAKRFSELGIDVFLGSARFTGSETVEVGNAKLQFSKAVIATGARAAVPSVPGLDEVDVLTNETVFSLTELPGVLGILGAGPIGCELAQTFARLGSQVHLIASRRGLLPKEDRDAAAILQKSLEHDGVNILGGGRTLKVSKTPEGRIRLQSGSDQHCYDYEVDRLLVASGRTPNVEDLGLDRAGVGFDRRGIQVDEHLRTTNPHIFAAGDVCSKFQFTHAADFMARTVIRNALFKGRAKATDLIIPWCTYTSPEIAHVGITLEEAESRNLEIDTYTQSLSQVDRAILEEETEGFVKIHVRKGKDEILGGTIVARNAGDLISIVTTAMHSKTGLGALGNVIFPYPTQAEAIRKLGDAFNRTRLTPALKKVFAKWLAWTR